MSWKTHLIMYFGTDNDTTVSEVIAKVEGVGFECQVGAIDFVYDWKDKQPSKEDISALGDKLSQELKGTGSVFNLDTLERT